MRRAFRFLLAVGTLAGGAYAQTTQGLISGRILNSVTGRPVAGASVSYLSSTLAAAGTSRSDASGYYFLPLLSAGTYTVRAAADGSQPQELQRLELPVAGAVQLDFRLRPLTDVWESGQYRSVFLPGTKTIVTFYGPDVDSSRSGTFEAQKGERGTLDTSASFVVDPKQIDDLPLQGRDVYTMLVSLPGVAADSGTGRGLGISVTGVRPSSSNYLLDGVENNNYLVTGPLAQASPEAIQEYRISTNNYSAEYGRTAGFIANAVTRAGSATYHLTAWEYLKNDYFNAADFADNLRGVGRRKQKQSQFGYQAGGPVLPGKNKLRDRLFLSSSLEELLSRGSQETRTLRMPSSRFISIFNLKPTSEARQLLEKFPVPALASNGVTAGYTVAPPVVTDRLLALERVDYATPGGRDHFMGRVALARTSQPDFIWSPYPDFISGLHQNTASVASNWQRSWTPRLTSELKLGYGDDNLWWDRAHPEIPTLAAGDGTQLPGSPAFYAYRNHNRSLEPVYSMVWTRNKHVFTAGAGLLFRSTTGYLTAGRDGLYLFDGAIGFESDAPQLFRVAVDRLSAKPVIPNYDRSYRQNQAFFFAQDSYRVTPTLTLNFGLRYERFGSPSNTGAVKDAILTLGTGKDFNGRLASATLAAPSAGSQQLYGADNLDFAPRFGFSWEPLVGRQGAGRQRGGAHTVVRGGFGIFYDRPFDNLWQNVRNNRVLLPTYFLPGVTTNYLQPVATAVQQYQPGQTDFPGLTLMDPKLRNGYVESSFLGVQHSVGNLVLEVNGTSSLGRRLVTTDVVNRPFTTTTSAFGYANESLPLVSWRSGQGISDYYATSALARYRGRNLQLQAAYTLSHSIDNQSDPLTGDFFDLNFTTINNGSGGAPQATFAKQFDPRADRGNSGFDQRHNLFLLGVWQPAFASRPIQRALLDGWKVSWLAAFRTGTPYTVNAPSRGIPDSGGTILNQRANLLNPAAVLPNPPTVAGGVRLLDPAGFASPGPNAPGSTGRNEFRGPGLYNVDLSLSRAFRVPKFLRLPESTLITLRADAFNVLNHANLGNPDSTLGDKNFGIATFGRQGTSSGFPALAPLNDAARQFQLMLRVEF
jgi:hypothetical protein